MMVRPGPSGVPDCAESRVQAVRGTEESQGSGNQQKKSGEDRWRANRAQLWDAHALYKLETNL